MVMSDTQVTPAGWYNDGSGVTRWWDGHQWGPLAPPVESRRFSGIAIAGFVLAVVSALFFMVPVLCIILGVLALLFGCAALYDTRAASGKRGRGFAVVGFLIPVTEIIVLVAFGIEAANS